MTRDEFKAVSSDLVKRYQDIQEKERELTFEKGRFDDDIKKLVSTLTGVKDEKATFNVVEIIHKALEAA